MGGKSKKSQRTKNNVRPSSSGRSAQSLSSVQLEAGTTNVTSKELPTLFPSLVVPNIDPLINPELQLCIKKLNKSHPFTKTKALQELSDLVVNSKVDDVVAALPSWVHFYRILTADPDRRVREATQCCHSTIVTLCGRRVAPHLKQLMPSWLQAQYDEHAPAQTIAQNSLAKTFPDSKLPDVISFCKSEVLTHLVENLIGTGESASVGKLESPEEKAVQAARLVSSSLHGLQYAAARLPRRHDAWLWEQLAALLRAPAFWGHAKHADTHIRAAWYGAVGCLIERFGAQFAEQYGQKALRLLSEGKESASLAAAPLWDCLLLFMHNIENWYKYLDKNELLNKRIFDVLENGGWGDARHLSNMLLPLLAHLPPDMLTKEFYLAFFDAIFNGLDKKTILSSRSERQSWITSLDECVRYLSIQQQDYVLEIVTSVHRTWLEKILSDTHDGQIKTCLVKYSAGRMAALVKYWLKQAKESHSDKYDQLIRNFWQNVGATTTTQIDKLSTNHDDIGRSIAGHILFLQTLKTSFIQEKMKQQSIKFDDDSSNVVETSLQERPQCDASIVETSPKETPLCDAYIVETSKEMPLCDAYIVETSKEMPLCDAYIVETSPKETPQCDASIVERSPKETPLCDAYIVETSKEMPLCDAYIVETSPKETPQCDASIVEASKETPQCDASIVEASKETPQCDASIVEASKETPQCDASIVETSKETPQCDASIVEASKETPQCDASIVEASKETPQCDASIVETSKETPQCDASIVEASKETPQCDASIVEASKETPQCDASIVERYNHNLNGIVEKVCGHYFEFASTRQISSPVLTPLITLLIDFNSKNLFTAIARQFDCDSTYDLYEKVLKAWLVGDTMRCKAIVDIMFLFLKHLSEPEQDALFDTFSQQHDNAGLQTNGRKRSSDKDSTSYPCSFGEPRAGVRLCGWVHHECCSQFPPSVVEWCLWLCLAPAHRGSRAGARWARGWVAAVTAGAACARLVARGDAPARALLLRCAATDRSGEILISESAMSKVVQQLSAAVMEVDSPALEQVAGAAAELVTALPPAGLGRLVLALFHLSVTVPRDDPRLSADTWLLVRGAWRAAVRRRGGEGQGEGVRGGEGQGEGVRGGRERAELLHDAAALVHERLHLHSNLSRKLLPPSKPSNDQQNTHKPLGVKQIEHVISLCPYLLSNNSQQDVVEIVNFSKHVFDITPIDPALIETFALRHDIVKGDLNCPFEDGEMTKLIINDYTKDTIDEVSEDNLKSYMNICIFRGIYLKTILLHKEDEDSKETWCNVLLLDDFFVTEFCKLLYGFTVICSMDDAYAFSPYYNIIAEANEILNVLITELMTEFTIETQDHVLHALSKIADVKGFYWSFTRMKFELEGDFYEIGSKHIFSADTYFQGKPGFSGEIAESNKSNTKSNQEQPESDQTIDTREETIEKSEEKTESNQDNTESGQDNTESGRDNAENGQDKTESNQDNNESSEEQTGNSQKKLESTQSELTQNIECDKDDDSYGINYYRNGPHASAFFHCFQAHWREFDDDQLLNKYSVMMRSFYAAHYNTFCFEDLQIDLEGQFMSDYDAGKEECNADIVVNAYYAHNHVMLFEQAVTAAPWDVVCFNAAVADFLAVLVQEKGPRLPPHHWDFVNVALCNLLASLLLSRDRWGCTKVALLARAVLALYAAVHASIAALPAAAAGEPLAPHVARLPTEWEEIFAPDLNSKLFTLTMYLLGKSTSGMTSNQVAVIDALMKCLARCRWALVPAARRGAELSLERLARGGAAALRVPSHHCYKYLAYALLKALIEPIVEYDESLLQAWKGAGGGGCECAEEPPPPEYALLYFDAAYCALRDLVPAATAHIRVCEETCSLAEGTDVHGLALGWFMLAETMAEVGARCDAFRSHHYFHIYRDHNYTEPLLTTALRLLPAEVFAHAQDGDAPADHAHMFTAMPDLSVYSCCSAATVSAAACRALSVCVRGAGRVHARGWRGAAPHRHARLLDNLLQWYISPYAVKDEFTLVQQRAAELENTEVTVIWSTNEAVITLTVEERPIELRVTLSRTHPLGLPELNMPGYSNIVKNNWVIISMGYQNVSLLGTLKLWIQAVNRKLERSSQCYICYCRLHHATGELPSVLCYQCRNKFHNACLRKWFATSNKSSCPLCRTAF